MKSSVRSPISFEEFKRLIARELNIEESKIAPESSFIRDLLADSIQLVELMLRLEEMGVEIPVDAAWEVETVGDAYRLYTEHVAAVT
ncbi:MAG: acyl carrier protein [Anaerolineae bacterium]|nr:acyl carrier protein [Anaerolineae bacterium]